MAGNELRRERIIRVALKVFSEEPIATVRLSDIARLAKLSRPLVTYYYSHTDALFYDVILHILEEMRRMTIASIERPADGVRETLRNYFDGYFEWREQKPKSYSLWLYFYYLASFSPDFRKLNDEVRSVGRDRIRQLIYRGIATRELSEALLPEIDDLAMQIQGTLTGNLTLVATESLAESGAMARATYVQVLRLLEGPKS